MVFFFLNGWLTIWLAIIFPFIIKPSLQTDIFLVRMIRASSVPTFIVENLETNETVQEIFAPADLTVHERPEDDEKLDMVQDDAQEIADIIFTTRF